MKTLADLIKIKSAQYADKIAYKFIKDKEIKEKTFAEFEADCNAFAKSLEDLQILGKHIAVIGPTSYEYLVTYLGTAISGSVIIPIDANLPKEEILDLLNRCDATMFVYDPSFSEIIKDVKANCSQIKHYVNMDALFDLLDENRGTFNKEIDPESLCAILYTSGTTGKSKGVMLSHKNLVHNVVAGDMKVPAGSVLLSVLPIHHAFCFNCDILVAFSSGCTVCINDSLLRVKKNIKRFAPDVMLLVPMVLENMYSQLNEAKKKSLVIPKPMIAKAAFGGNLKTIFCGGAYLNPEIIKGMREYGIEVLQGYGMTESAPRISCNYHWNHKDESVGQLLDGVEAKIVDGELWVKSDSVMMGYYKNPEATAETLVDGWLVTGDLGYVDEDRFVYLTGRKKNLIILSNGENVSAEEIENKLLAEPLIAEIVVYGENNTITAEIFPNLEYAKKARIKNVREALQKIIDAHNTTVPMTRRVHTLKVRETEFEKTTSKKIKRTSITLS